MNSIHQYKLFLILFVSSLVVFNIKSDQITVVNNLKTPVFFRWLLSDAGKVFNPITLNAGSQTVTIPDNQQIKISGFNIAGNITDSKLGKCYLTNSFENIIQNNPGKTIYILNPGICNKNRANVCFCPPNVQVN